MQKLIGSSQWLQGVVMMTPGHILSGPNKAMRLGQPLEKTHQSGQR